MSALFRALLAFLLALVVSASPAWAYVYFTPEALIQSFFPDADAVEAVTFTPDPTQLAAIEARLGYKLPKPAYTLSIGHRGADTLGYAVVDEQLGQHQPITFGVLVAPDGTVRQVEVMVYREAYGDGVRAPGFRKQFLGLSAASPMRAGREIQIVSGATISSRSLSTGVRRAAALVEAWTAAHPAGT